MNDDSANKPVSEETWTRIRTALYAGQKIEAIKLFREASGAELKEAKEAVEALEAELRRASPELFSKAKGSGCSVSVGLFAALLYIAGS